MTHEIQLEDGMYGRRAVITGAWSDEMTDFLVDNGIVELELNDGKGWRGSDLFFLAKLKHLKSFKIIDLKIFFSRTHSLSARASGIGSNYLL